MRRRVAALAACLALSALGSAALAPQAMANREDCPSQYFCLWDGASYGGTRVQFHDNGWQNLTDYGFNDLASSVYNNTNRYAKIAVNINGGGEKVCIGPHGYTSFGGGGFPSYDNEASSVWLGTEGC